MNLRPLLSSLRLRTVWLSTLIVTAVLLLSIAVLTVTVRQVLISTAVESARIRADEVAALAISGTLPPIIATSGDEETFIQVIVDGAVIASSEDVEGERPLRAAPLAPGEVRVAEVEDLPSGEGERYELVSVGVTTPDGDGVVHVGVSFEAIEDFVDILERVGLAGVPLIALALAAVLWRVVGRTLRPIEQVRQQAASIGGQTLDERVPVPPTNDEVARLATTLNEMLDRIQQSAVKQDRFASDAAHELRSPLASLRVQLEAARAAKNPVNWDAVSGDLLDETLRMQTLTEQLLSLVALGPERIARAARPVDLDDVVATVVTQVRATARADVGIEVAELAPTQVSGVPSLLSTMVRNVVANAAAHAETQVRCELVADGRRAVLTVEDDGPGIPIGDLSRVFDPFVRLDEGRARQQGGAGLGLALVRDVAAAHGGSATAGVSRTLGGALLTLTIPLTPDA